MMNPQVMCISPHSEALACQPLAWSWNVIKENTLFSGGSISRFLNNQHQLNSKRIEEKEKKDEEDKTEEDQETTEAQGTKGA